MSELEERMAFEDPNRNPGQPAMVKPTPDGAESATSGEVPAAPPVQNPAFRGPPPAASAAFGEYQPVEAQRRRSDEPPPIVTGPSPAWSPPAAAVPAMIPSDAPAVSQANPRRNRFNQTMAMMDYQKVPTSPIPAVPPTGTPGFQPAAVGEAVLQQAPGTELGGGDPNATAAVAAVPPELASYLEEQRRQIEARARRAAEANASQAPPAVPQGGGAPGGVPQGALPTGALPAYPGGYPPSPGYGTPSAMPAVAPQQQGAPYGSPASFASPAQHGSQSPYGAQPPYTSPSPYGSPSSYAAQSPYAASPQPPAAAPVVQPAFVQQRQAPYEPPAAAPYAVPPLAANPQPIQSPARAFVSPIPSQPPPGSPWQRGAGDATFERNLASLPGPRAPGHRNTSVPSPAVVATPSEPVMAIKWAAVIAIATFIVGVMVGMGLYSVL